MNILQFFQRQVTALVITAQTCPSVTIRKKITLPAASKLLYKDRHAKLRNVLVHHGEQHRLFEKPSLYLQLTGETTEK
jgi:hypothetical protein